MTVEREKCHWHQFKLPKRMIFVLNGFIWWEEFILGVFFTFKVHEKTYPSSVLWMEAGSSGGLDRNRVYRLSNTIAKNLWTACSVSTIGSSQSISSIQSQEFVALQQHTTRLTKKYEQLSADYEQFCQMIMDIRS